MPSNATATNSLEMSYHRRPPTREKTTDRGKGVHQIYFPSTIHIHNHNQRLPAKLKQLARACALRTKLNQLARAQHNTQTLIDTKISRHTYQYILLRHRNLIYTYIYTYNLITVSPKEHPSVTANVRMLIYINIYKYNYIVQRKHPTHGRTTSSPKDPNKTRDRLPTKRAPTTDQHSHIPLTS